MNTEAKMAALTRAVKRFFEAEGAEVTTDRSAQIKPILRLRRHVKAGPMMAPKAVKQETADASRQRILDVPWFDFRRFETGDNISEVDKFGHEAITAGVLRLPYEKCAFVIPLRSKREGNFTQVYLLTQGYRAVKISDVLTVYRDGTSFFIPADGQHDLGEESRIGFLLAAMSARIAKVVPRKIADGSLVVAEAASGDVYREVIIGGAPSDSDGSSHPHASPRLHWRRGHIRRLGPIVTTWVKPTLVGDAGHGTVIHDYVASP